MREFLRGWKRKLGVVTLLMACVFVAGWVRSTSAVDVILLPSNPTNYIVVSGGQQWRIIRTGCLEVEAPWRDGDTVVHGVKLVLNNKARWPGFVWNSETATRLDIFGSWDDNKSVVRMIPYWVLVIPLVLVSTYLILSKPRSGKKPEPSPAAGT